MVKVIQNRRPTRRELRAMWKEEARKRRLGIRSPSIPSSPGRRRSLSRSKSFGGRCRPILVSNPSSPQARCPEQCLQALSPNQNDSGSEDERSRMLTAVSDRIQHTVVEFRDDRLILERSHLDTPAKLLLSPQRKRRNNLVTKPLLSREFLGSPGLTSDGPSKSSTPPQITPSPRGSSDADYHSDTVQPPVPQNLSAIFSRGSHAGVASQSSTHHSKSTHSRLVQPTLPSSVRPYERHPRTYSQGKRSCQFDTTQAHRSSTRTLSKPVVPSLTPVVQSSRLVVSTSKPFVPFLKPIVPSLKPVSSSLAASHPQSEPRNAPVTVTSAVQPARPHPVPNNHTTAALNCLERPRVAPPLLLPLLTREESDVFSDIPSQEPRIALAPKSSRVSSRPQAEAIDPIDLAKRRVDARRNYRPPAVSVAVKRTASVGAAKVTPGLSKPAPSRDVLSIASNAVSANFAGFLASRTSIKRTPDARSSARWVGIIKDHVTRKPAISSTRGQSTKASSLLALPTNTIVAAANVVAFTSPGVIPVVDNASAVAFDTFLPETSSALSAAIVEPPHVISCLDLSSSQRIEEEVLIMPSTSRSSRQSSAVSGTGLVIPGTCIVIIKPAADFIAARSSPLANHHPWQRHALLIYYLAGQMKTVCPMHVNTAAEHLQCDSLLSVAPVLATSPKTTALSNIPPDSSTLDLFAPPTSPVCSFPVTLPDLSMAVHIPPMTQAALFPVVVSPKSQIIEEQLSTTLSPVVELPTEVPSAASRRRQISKFAIVTILSEDDLASDGTVLWNLSQPTRPTIPDAQATLDVPSSRGAILLGSPRSDLLENKRAVNLDKQIAPARNMRACLRAVATAIANPWKSLWRAVQI